MDKNYTELLAQLEIAETETKNRRLQILVYPSIYKGLKILAEKYNTSINNIINSVIENIIDKAKAKVNNEQL